MLFAEYALVKDIASETAVALFEGGAGSGNWGHKGRPGRVGGSLPGGRGISGHAYVRSVSSSRMSVDLRGEISGNRITSTSQAITFLKERFPGQKNDRYLRAVSKAGMMVPPGSAVRVTSSVMARHLRSRRYYGSEGAMRELIRKYPGQASDRYQRAIAKAGVAQATAAAASTVGVVGVVAPVRSVGPPAQTPEATWRGQLREKFKEVLTGAAAASGYTAMIRNSGGDFHAGFYRGDVVRGTVNFTMNIDRRSGEIGGFFMNEGERGSGLGGSVIDALVKHAQKTGIRKIDLFANGREGIGRYAWAVMGFDFKVSYDRERASNKFKSFLSEKGVDATGLSFDHSWEIASFVSGGRKLGKEFMTRGFYSYDASFDARPGSLSEKVFRNYMSGRKISEPKITTKAA